MCKIFNSIRISAKNCSKIIINIHHSFRCYSKYEKSKQMALEVREKEAKLIEKLDFCQQQMKLQEQRYDKLKNHALTQLER